MISPNWCLTIPKLMPDNDNDDEWWPTEGFCRTTTSGFLSQSSGIIFGISETIPEMVPVDRKAPFLGPVVTSFGIVRHQFWDRQAPVLGSHTFFGV